ncbi:hypothetical protein BURMUCGD1_3920 [Burkholderia multivorans CGD1]|nr:hypothetical protein BURMUCGD1_3920 [Burkholderia multivorans CGD1]
MTRARPPRGGRAVAFAHRAQRAPTADERFRRAFSRSNLSVRRAWKIIS